MENNSSPSNPGTSAETNRYPENGNTNRNDKKSEQLDERQVAPGSKSHFRELLIQQEEVTFTKLHKNAGAEFISGLNSSQKDKLLDILSKSEDNTFKFRTQHLEAQKAVELERIKRKGEGIRTFKWILICAVTTFLIVTILVALMRPEHFTHWLAFVTGIAGGGLGGYGVAKSKVFEFNERDVTSKSVKEEDDKEEES